MTSGPKESKWKRDAGEVTSQVKGAMLVQLHGTHADIKHQVPSTFLFDIGSLIDLELCHACWGSWPETLQGFICLCLLAFSYLLRLLASVTTWLLTWT